VDLATVAIVALIAGLAGGAVGAALVGTVEAILRQEIGRSTPNRAWSFHARSASTRKEGPES
jgi:hypothetical protein